MDGHGRTLRTQLPRWWSHVTFHSLLLVLLAGLLFFARLGCPLLEPEEARYAEVPRQMLAAGNFAVPVLHGTPYYQKPPLLYWLVMASYSICGVHDWAARLVPGTAGVLVVLLTYGWGRGILGTKAALVSALVLCLSPRFVYLERMLTTDSLLCVWVTAALLAACRAVSGPELRWRWWLTSAAASGLGLLTKGPVALALLVPPVLTFQLLERRGCGFSLRPWLLYLAVAAGVALPWYAAMTLHDAEAAATFFWLHNVVRYVAPFDHAKPCWFYLPGLLVCMLPWILLLIPWPRLVGFFLPSPPLRGRGVGGEEANAYTEQAPPPHPRPLSPEYGGEGRKVQPPPTRWMPRELRTPALGFFLLAFLWCVLFFSASGCKRAVYILPALPLLALVLGSSLAAVVPARPRQLAYWGICGAVLFALLFAAVYELLPAYHRKFALRGQVRRHHQLGADAELSVCCYPKRWDSVSFYLQRSDIRVYQEEQLGDLIAHLQTQPRTLVFVKADASLQQLRAALPPSLELVPWGPQRGRVLAGLVKIRDAYGGS